MLFVLALGNSTSTTNLVSAWLGPTGIGSIVLALGVFIAAYQIYLDRRDRKMERDRELDERPHFEMVGAPFLQTQELLLSRGDKPEDLSKIKIGVVKVKLENKGRMTAKGARVFLELGEPKEETLHSSVWTSHVNVPYAVPVSVLTSTGKSPCEVGDFLRLSFFMPGFLGHSEEMDVPPNAVVAAVILFTVEGCEKVFHANPNVKDLGSLPLDTIIGLNVVMDDAPYSAAMRNVPLHLKNWNGLEPSV